MTPRAPAPPPASPARRLLPRRAALRSVRGAALAVLGVAALLALAMAPPPAAAQQDDSGRIVLTARAQWEYAEALFQGREYFRAISEYKRLLYFFPQSGRTPAARVRIGEAWLNGGEPAQAADHFTGLLAAPELSPLRPELHYLRGLARLELDGAAPYTLRERHVAAAVADLREIPATWPGAARVQGFVQALEHPQDVPGKSPWLAGGLSAVLPGAGSAYVGNWSEAALAFFINALFISATVRAFDTDHDDVGVVLGIGALAFYGGAIYAAANGAHRYNDRARADYLAAQRTRFGIVLLPEGIGGLLERRF